MDHPPPLHLPQGSGDCIFTVCGERQVRIHCKYEVPSVACRRRSSKRPPSDGHSTFDSRSRDTVYMQRFCSRDLWGATMRCKYAGILTRCMWRLAPRPSFGCPLAVWVGVTIHYKYAVNIALGRLRKGPQGPTLFVPFPPPQGGGPIICPPLRGAKKRTWRESGSPAAEGGKKASHDPS